jgi:uncharacterized protein DUF3617
MNSTKGLVVAAVAATAFATSWAQVSVKPGQYRVTLEMNLPGAPQPTKHEAFDCISAEDAKDLAKAVLRELATEDSCTSNNVKTAGNKITFDVTCDIEGTPATSSTELTVGADSYSAVMKMTLGGAVTTTKMDGQWVAATCTEE